MQQLRKKLRKNLVSLKKKYFNFKYHFIREPDPDKWIFIIGCYNSGTTLLNSILGLHPMIGSMTKEGQEYTTELPKPKDFGIPRMWAFKPELFYLNENSINKIKISKIKRQWAIGFNDSQKPLLVEKTITHCARMRWLQKHFKNSYFICIVRNGYAVAEGIKRKAGYPIDQSIYQWKYANEVMLKDMPYLKNKILINYENLTEDTLTTLKKITDFLDIPSFEKSILKRSFTVQKENRKIKNLNYRSFQNLSEAEFETINNVAADLLKQFGYETVRKNN